jgi:multidrug efflux pump subunit AcrA (membrane-fusion protein)
MKTTSLVVSLCAAVLACGIACTRGNGDKEGENESIKANALVSVQAATVGTVEETLAGYGVVEPSADATVPVVADHDCTVSKVWVHAGQVLKRGEAVADVRDSQGARLDAARAKIDVDFATQDLTRVTAQRDKGLATNADVGQAQAEVDKARAELAAVGGVGTTRTVHAPTAGLVSSVAVKPGDAVSAGGALVVMAASTVGNGATSQRVRLGVQVQPQVDPESHQAGVAVALTSAPFVQGVMCRGDIVVRTAQNALIVPRNSVVDGAVFVVQGTGPQAHSKRVVVEVLLDNGTHAAVQSKDSALSAGVAVVIMGAVELEDGMAVRLNDTPEQRGADDADDADAKVDDAKGATKDGDKAGDDKQDDKDVNKPSGAK